MLAFKAGNPKGATCQEIKYQEDFVTVKKLFSFPKALKHFTKRYNILPIVQRSRKPLQRFILSLSGGTLSVR
jgi:hypothetical protein